MQSQVLLVNTDVPRQALQRTVVEDQLCAVPNLEADIVGFVDLQPDDVTEPIDRIGAADAGEDSVFAVLADCQPFDIRAEEFKPGFFQNKAE